MATSGDWGAGVSAAAGAEFLASRSCGAWDAGQPLLPGVTVADVIATFVPKGMSGGSWLRIGGLVREAATAARVKSPYRAEILMSTLAGFVHWCEREGLPITAEAVFHPDTIDRYVFVGIANLTEGTKANYRTILRQAGAAILGPPLYRVGVSFAERDPVAPYDSDEFSAVVGWLRGLRTPRMQENALVLVACCAGGGLASQDITRLVGTDVEVRGEDGVLIHVPGARERAVPVLRRWEEHVAARAAAVGDRPMFLPARTKIARRDISSFIAKLPLSDAPKLSTTRLRHTWIVHQLTLGTPLPIVAAAAGAGAETLARLVKYIAVPEPGEVSQILRDPERR